MSTLDIKGAQAGVSDLPTDHRAKSDAATQYDEAAAFSERWGIFDCGLRDDGSPRVELQRLNCPASGCPRFADDLAAWRHVVDRAHAGSILHIAALSMLDPVERFAIEALYGRAPGL